MNLCKIVSYFVSQMAKQIRRSQDDLWRTEYFERIAKTIASYAVSMGGIEAIAFTAGVGENS